MTDDDDFDIGIEKEPLPGLETGGELVTPESTEDTAITVADNSCDPSGKKTQIQITENAVKQKPLVEATSPDAGISANNSVQVKTSDCSQTPCDASIEKYPGQGAKTYCSNEPNASSSQEQAVSHPADDAILTERVVTSDEKSPKKCKNVEDAKQKLIKVYSSFTFVSRLAHYMF